MAIRGGRSIGWALQIKYGLPGEPSDSAIRLWRIRTNQLIAEGREREAAGRVAAAESFTGFQTKVYASEADDISSLLDAAGGR